MPLDFGILPDDFLPHLDEVNRIVKASGDKLEGNLFYCNHEPDPGRHNIVSHFIAKRHNYGTVCKQSRCMLEVGVNGGHSALLALAQGVEYHGVDICWHPYTQPVADYLKKTFGDKFHFYAGDSLKVLPAMRIERPWLRFDLLHVDGYHTLQHCRADFENGRQLTLQNGWVIIDDSDLKHIRDYFDQQVKAGTILPAQPEGWIDNPHHAIGRVA